MKFFLLGAVSMLALLVATGIADREYPTIRTEFAVPQQAAIGGDVPLQITTYRKRLCHTLIETDVIDSTGVRFTLPDQDYAVMGHLGLDQYIRHVPVSAKAKPGKGEIRITAVWRCNPMHYLYPLIHSVDVPINLVSIEANDARRTP